MYCSQFNGLLSWESKDLYPRAIINQTLEKLSSSSWGVRFAGLIYSSVDNAFMTNMYC